MPRHYERFHSIALISRLVILIATSSLMLVNLGCRDSGESSSNPEFTQEDQGPEAETEDQVPPTIDPQENEKADANSANTNEIIPTPIRESPGFFTKTPQPDLLPELAVINPENAAQLQPLRRMGDGVPTGAIAYSTDGRLVATATSAAIYVYDSVTLTELNKIEHSQWIEHIAFSSESQKLAATTGNGVIVWDLNSGATISEWTSPEENSQITAISPDLELVVLSIREGETTLRRVADGSIILTLPDLEYASVSAFSQDSEMLITGSGEIVQLWRVSDGKLLTTMTGHADSEDESSSNEITGVAISPDGQTLASTSHNEGALRVWRATDGVQLFAVESERGGGSGVAFSPDGQLLALSVQNYEIMILDAVDGEILTSWYIYGRDNQLQFSPDGKTLMSGEAETGAWLWRVADGESLGWLPSHFDIPVPELSNDIEIRDLAFSRDGQTLGGSTVDGPRLWNVTNGAPLPLAEGHLFPIISVAYSPDGKWVATADYNEIRIWRANDLEPVKKISLPVYKMLAFSNDGKTLISWGEDHIIRMWRTDDWSLERSLEVLHDGEEVTLWPIFSPNGNFLAGISDDGKVYVWRLNDGEVQGNILTESTADSSPSRVAFSPDGQTLAVDFGTQIQLWDISTNSKLTTLDGLAMGTSAMAVSPDGKTLASIDSLGRMRLWQVADGLILWQVDLPPEVLYEILAFSPDGQTLVVGSLDLGTLDGNLYLYQATDGQAFANWDASLETIYSLAISPDGQTMVSGGRDTILRLWQLSDGKLLKTRATTLINELPALSPNLQYTVTKYGDHIYVQSLVDGEFLALLEYDEDSSYYVEFLFSPDEQLLAANSFDSPWIQIWRTSDWSPTTIHTGHPDGVGNMAFSPDGEMLATSNGDYDTGTIIISRVSNGERIMTLEGHPNSIAEMAFSPDGQTLFSTSYDDTIKIWRVTDGALLATLDPDFEYGPGALAISPDGSLLATIDRNGNTLHLWRVADGTLLGTFEGGFGGGRGLSFSPDGMMLAAGAEDGTVLVWGIPK